MKRNKVNIKKTVKNRIELKQKMGLPKSLSGKSNIKKRVEIKKQQQIDRSIYIYIYTNIDI